MKKSKCPKCKQSVRIGERRICDKCQKIWHSKCLHSTDVCPFCKESHWFYC